MLQPRREGIFEDDQLQCGQRTGCVACCLLSQGFVVQRLIALGDLLLNKIAVEGADGHAVGIKVGPARIVVHQASLELVHFFTRLLQLQE